jgi:hypothetical protein
MRAEPVPSAEVDVCDACGALWIDWFDGDISTLAAEAEAARVDRGEPSPIRANAVEPRGSGHCPRCTRPLTPESYRFHDAAPDELVRDVDLLRCPECAGSFVPRSSAHLLLDRVSTPRSATLWEMLAELVAVLKRLVS